MSLLEQLKCKRACLKNTETIVTSIDGRRFKETAKETCEIEGKEFGFVVDTKPDSSPAAITEHIFLGSQDCCDNEVLRKFDITHVLSVGVQPECLFSDIKYKFVPCLDLPETNIREILQNDCIPFLLNVIENNNKVLVHCNAGVSRSPAVVIGFLILTKNSTYSEAFEIVKKARSCTKPNVGFEKQLKKLESSKKFSEEGFGHF